MRLEWTKELGRFCLSVPVLAFGLFMMLILVLLAPRAQASCVNILSVDGVMYARAEFGLKGSLNRPLTEADLSAQFRTVARNAATTDWSLNAESGSTADRCGPYEDYSTDLPVGTPLYAMKGYAPTFRLIARPSEDVLELFEAGARPGATRGRDRYDVDGKVVSVKLVDRHETLLAVIDEPATISLVAELMLDAPIKDNGVWSHKKPFSLIYGLKDGTVVVDFWYSDTNELGSGIKPPDRFFEILRSALREQRLPAEADRAPEATPIAS